MFRIARLIITALLLGIGLFLEHSTILLIGFMALYLFIGGDVLWHVITSDILRKRQMDEHFLMTIATIGAFCIGQYAEAVSVMLFYQLGTYFEDLAVGKSKKSIADLMDIRPDYANIKQNGKTIRISPDKIKVGDIIIVKAGEKIPLDGIVIEGTSFLDTKALTGETVPRTAKPGDTVLSGCINQNGLLTIEVTKTFGESTASKIIHLVENAANKKAATENFITVFARYYTPAVVATAVAVAIIPPIFFGNLTEWISRSLIFLVISCPCALVVSIPLSFFGGIGKASRNGILVKGGNYLEALENLDTVVFDKTGTLTKGTFNVTEIHANDGFTTQELLGYAAKAEIHSNHPIALSIKEAYGEDLNENEITNYEEIAGHGIFAKLNDKAILCGNQKLMQENKIKYTEATTHGTQVYLAVNEKFAGYIIIADELKEDSAESIALLKKKGVRKTVMLTGDNAQTALEIAEKLGLDEVHSELLPADKVEKVEELLKNKGIGSLAFVGDGINDAPVLARADVGIAMGGLGSDAAIEAADVVLMTDEPSRLATAIQIARATKRVVWQNITLAFGVKLACMILGIFGLASLWEAVFADVGVTVIAVLNSTRVTRS